jgi:lauroyl/myristoyl acyltransferase
VSGLRRLEQLALPPAVRVLRRLPFGLAEGILIGLSFGQAVLDPGRVRRAYAWAAAGGAGTRSAWAVVLGLFVHRGRALAASPAAAILDPEQLRQRIEVEGLDRLEHARRRGGVILLGFHLGMLSIDRSLPLLGYHVTAIGSEDRFHWPPPPRAWREFQNRSRMHVWTRAAPGSRADALYRLRQAASAGEVVMIMGAAGQGRVLFDLSLPGRPLAVRAGWFALRRLTGLPTLPLLGYREGRQWKLTIHPPLPAPDPDERRDRECCRDALAAILEEFVARFPDQCLFLAMHADERPPSAPGARSVERS